ncbi:MAG TPA: Uma2 family endonuclease [Candidatus Ozemobacteraceae bacterium]|nr:Uma2 family endonuclease [Candidatus Ozemobacteraceae bacterium]
MTLLRPQNRRYTYADYLTWPDEERWEIVDGEAHAMTPAPTPLHQSVVIELGTQFHTFLRGKPCRVFPAPIDLLIPVGDEPDEEVATIVQPDLIVVCDEKKVGGKRIRGAPDLVIEVSSPATSSRDAIVKRRCYERAGAREFWLVHPIDRLVTVFRLGADGTFDKPLYFDSEGRIDVTVLPGLTIDLALVFPPQPRVVRQSPFPYSSGE